MRSKLPLSTLQVILTASLALFAQHTTLVKAYTPAQSTNKSIDGILPLASDGVTSQFSSLSVEWVQPNPGNANERISYQLAGAGTNGLSQGALVYFSEETNLTEDLSTTPWIAFVSCDRNASQASDDNDIFTLAQERGAVAALLYSERSNSCTINTGYEDPASFEQIMDIFAIKTLDLTQLIQSRLSSLHPAYRTFNASLLNASLPSISQYINASSNSSSSSSSSSSSPSPSGSFSPNNNNNSTGGNGYMFATLLAGNATQMPASTSGGMMRGGNGTGPGGGSGSGNEGGMGGKSKKGNQLAMIILYTITGCVSALFCVVICSGAIRALRHPERYGRRAQAQDPTNTMGPHGQRAVGLARAVLDTFPIIRFGGSGAAAGAADGADGDRDRQQGNEGGEGEGEGEGRKSEDLESGLRGRRGAEGGGGGGGEVIEMRETGRIRREVDEDGGGDGSAEDVTGERRDREEAWLEERRTRKKGGAVSKAEGAERVLNGTQTEREDISDLGMAVLGVYDRLSNDSHSNPGTTQLKPNDSSNTTNTPSPPPDSQSPSPFSSPSPQEPAPAQLPQELAVDPTTIGHETCPICILDFELGDALRVLPCEGRHRFHQECVDQWLLEMSSSCPLCREDFQTLEAMVEDDTDIDEEDEDEDEDERRRRRGSRRRHRDNRRSGSEDSSASAGPSNTPTNEEEGEEEVGQSPISDRGLRPTTINDYSEERERTTSTSTARRLLRPPRLSSRYLRFAQRRRASASASAQATSNPDSRSSGNGTFLGRSAMSTVTNRILAQQEERQRQRERERERNRERQRQRAREQERNRSGSTSSSTEEEHLSHTSLLFPI